MAIVNQWRKTPDIYPIEEVRAVDGDTLEARILLPFDCSVMKRIRLKGWWADELEGLYRQQGHRAWHLLHLWCSGKALWLHAPSCRMDKYGRVVAHLIHEGRIINPKDVIGLCQLSEKDHNAHKAASKSAGFKASGGARGGDGRYVADTQSKCVIGHPEANLDPFLGTEHGNGHDDY